MEIRKFGRLTLYGPHPLERDSDGHLKYPMGVIFPAYESMILESGLHVTLAFDFITEIGGQRGSPLNEEEESKVYEDLVALVLRGNHVVIRSIPENMNQCFRAAELLEEVVPADMIRFTGRRDPNVREAFKLRGESWKIAPRYFTVEEINKQIKLSQVSVKTKNRYYYKMESGGRLMSYQQFTSIRESLVNLSEFKNRICEVVELYKRRNKQFVRELDFFMVDHEKFDFPLIQKLADYLKTCKSWGDAERKTANELYEAALFNFKNATSPDFLCDDPNNPLWRNYIYSELNDIPPTEESILGMSGEFNMNIQWVPGCHILDGRMLMDPNVEEPIAKLLEDFSRFYGQLDYINLGRVMRSQSRKRAEYSYREVYIAVLKQSTSSVEQIRMLRKVRRNTLYYLNRGFSLDKAQRLTEGYLQYTQDRGNILTFLGVNTPPLHRVSRPEELPGIGTVTIVFFDRPYIRGLATDKVPDYYYEHEDFVTAQAALLGEAAGLNLIVGRSDMDTGDAYFGDGDEMLQFEPGSYLPQGLVLADFTGAFADVVSPLEKFLPFYVSYLADMLARVQVKGMDAKEILATCDIFIEAMKKSIAKSKEMLSEGGAVGEMIGKIVADRDVEINPIRIKWEKTLRRLHNFKLEAFFNKMRGDLCRKLSYC
ncbi:MAG TPA: hypothetical protein VM123_11490 [archaeon]|nr:hypothetical protein [archaeon]